MDAKKEQVMHEMAKALEIAQSAHPCPLYKDALEQYCKVFNKDVNDMLHNR